MPEGKLRPLIVPIFIPNQGCPHRCIFCEQEQITSHPSQPIDSAQVRSILDEAIHSKHFNLRRSREVAFYGGTFTRLPVKRMNELLETVGHYVEGGFFQSVRISTRPDAIDEKRLELMKGYRVLTVELGAQSMDNDVLVLSKRGHSAEDTINAVQLLREYGFRVGLQLMPGLPGDSEEKFYSTIREIIRLNPDMVRLYPAVVLRGTELAQWHKEQRYIPLSLEGAVSICAESCRRLEEAGIPVIRIGLMSSPSLLEKGQIIAGPWHPAFGFLVRSHIYHKTMQTDLPAQGKADRIRVRAPRREIPLLRGYQNQGLRLLKKKTGANIIKIEPDDSIPSGHAKIETL